MISNNHIRVIPQDTAKHKVKVKVKILTHSSTGTTVKMGIDSPSGNECSMVTSIIPVIKETEIKQDIVFHETLKVNMNNTMITPKIEIRPETRTRTRYTANNAEELGEEVMIELEDGCELSHLVKDLLVRVLPRIRTLEIGRIII